MTLCLTLRRRIKRTHWEDSVQAVWLHSWAFIKLQHRYVLFKRTLNHLEAEMLFDLSVVMILLHHSLLPFCVDITTAAHKQVYIGFKKEPRFFTPDNQANTVFVVHRTLWFQKQHHSKAFALVSQTSETPKPPRKWKTCQAAAQYVCV